MWQTMSQGNTGLDMNTMLPFLLIDDDSDDEPPTAGDDDPSDAGGGVAMHGAPGKPQLRN